MEEYRKIHIDHLFGAKRCMEHALAFIVERSLLRGGLDDKECAEIASLAAHVLTLHQLINGKLHEESAGAPEGETKEDDSNGQDAEDEEAPMNPTERIEVIEKCMRNIAPLL